jgi:AraC-like DNA-binding protein
MYYREIQPPAPLKDYVRFFWTVEQTDPLQSRIYKLFAEGLPGIVFFHNSQYGNINGPASTAKEFPIQGCFKMSGAFLYPYTLPLIFKLPSHELINASYDLRTMLGKQGAELEEKIMEANDDHRLVELLSDFLVQRINQSKKVNSKQQACIQHIIQSPVQGEITSLAFQSGISIRQFERNTKHYTGFSPKLFSRLMRFQTSLRFPAKHTIASLTDLAYHTGYFDQSHFIREFKEFAGISPKEYFNLKHEDRADTFVAWQ